MSEPKLELPQAESGPGGERCDRCYYWWHPPGESPPTDGECRRHPPEVPHAVKVIHGLLAMEEEASRDDVWDDVVADNRREWPETEKDDWCGGFKPHPKEQR